MFADIIEMLLQKKAALREEIEREFAARSAKIDALLDMAGYVEQPVVEQAADEVAVADEAVNAEAAEAVTDEAVAEVRNEQVVY